MTEGQVVNSNLRSDSLSYRIFDTYQALQPEEIRLLEILPASSPSWLTRLVDKIECNLIHARLNDDVEYEAISYCWGESKPKSEIVIANHGGHRFQVTDSLYEALSRFRRTDTKRLVWADFMCINQKDPIEQAEQVSHMTDIYRRAKQVLGWLGPAYRVEESVALMNEFSRSTEKDKVPNPAWAADFSSFLGNAYFSRLWIIQEVAVAKKLILCFGKFELSWEDFCELLESFLDLLGGTLNTSNADIGLERIMMLVSTRNIITEHVHQPERLSSLFSTYQVKRLDQHRDLAEIQKGDFARIVSHGRMFGASDPRDHVFALSGLVPEESKSIQPSYKLTNTADKVFYQFTVLTIKQSQSLDILVQAGLSESQLPSWVPDLTRRLTHTPLDIRRYSANAEPFIESNAIYSGLLNVSGYKIGTIAELVAGLENKDVTFDESKCSVPWQPADPVPLEKPQLLEREISNTFDIIGPLYYYKKARTEGTLNSYLDFGGSIVNAFTAVNNGFAKTTPRISPEMERSWYHGSTANGKVIYAIFAYLDMLIGGPTLSVLPANTSFSDMFLIERAWQAQIRNEPFKTKSHSARDPQEIPKIPAKLKEAYFEAEKCKIRDSVFKQRKHIESQGAQVQASGLANLNSEKPEELHKSRTRGDWKSPEQKEQRRKEQDARIRQYREANKPVNDDEKILGTLTRTFDREVERMSRGRKFAITDRELGMAWVPQLSQEKDEVWILVGASVPFVLRPVDGRKGAYRLVGEAYHYGVMRGEYFTGEYQRNYSAWVDGWVELAQKEDLQLI